MVEVSVGVVRVVTEIISVESWADKFKKVHVRTTALLDNQEEASGYGSFKVGDSVEAWYDEKWQLYKMRKPTKKK